MPIDVRPATDFEDVATIVGPRRPDANVCWCLSYRLSSKENAALRGPARGERTSFGPVALVIFIVSSPLAAAAQTSPASLDGRSVELRSDVRWLHERQQPRFSPFDRSQQWIGIDSVRSVGDGAPRTVHLTPRRAGLGSQLETDAMARPIRIHAPSPGDRPQTLFSPAEGRMLLRGSLADQRAGLRLPETTVWDLIPGVRPYGLASGATWTDTLDLTAEYDGMRQTLRGPRVRKVVGDTTVEGRRLWIVRDSAQVEYAERWLRHEHTRDTVVVIERVASGVIRGRSLFDSSLALARLRADTTFLSGEASLIQPDGRRYTTGARFERTRSWVLHDAASREAREAELQAELQAGRTGMVGLPVTEVERRLARGDTALRDSLLSRWRAEIDPGERTSQRSMLRWWDDPSRDWPDRLTEMAVADGDTVTMVRTLARQLRPEDRFSETDLRVLLPFLADPGLAFAFGMDSDPLHGTLRQALLAAPPAVTPDQEMWPCTPAACAMLASADESATDPRLRDLALITRLVLEPELWDGVVLERAAQGAHFLDPAVELIQGVGATWPAASREAVPPEGAGWREWLDWMSGVDAGYLARNPGLPRNAIRFGPSHATALRFQQALTGRDVATELTQRLETVTSDSARLVFDTILLGLGARPLDPADIAERLLSGSVLAREGARREMHQLLDESPPADPATAAELADRLLRWALRGEDVWTPLDPDDPRRSMRPRRITEGVDSIYLLADGLPPAVQERWEEMVHVVGATRFRNLADPAPGLYVEVGQALEAGPFVRINLNYTVLSRREGLPPGGYSGSIIAYLMRAEGGWVVVHEVELIS